MSGVLREKELKRRKQRREKLALLREKYRVAKSDGEKAAIFDKVKKVAVWLSEDEFTASIK